MCRWGADGGVLQRYGGPDRHFDSRRFARALSVGRAFRHSRPVADAR